MKIKKLYFVDIIYFTCYSFYRRYEEKLNEFSGQALTSVCLSLNIAALLILLQEAFEVSFFENKWNSLFISLPMLLIVVFRYNKYMKIEQIEESLYHYDLGKLEKLKIIASAYIVFSIFGTIIFFIIIGELNNPPPFWDKWF